MGKKQVQENGQYAQCIELSSYEGSDGKTHETALMRLDNKEGKDFEVFVTKYFNPVVGKIYYPDIDVKAVARTSSKGKAYVKHQVVVNWFDIEALEA